MAANDVITRDAQGNDRLHPYIVALVRWCVSCVWRTATVLLHRLLFAPLPITGSPVPKAIPKRAATHEHLHPEPKVECVVLHQPAVHNVDVIFVHGLYGSLGNTWRQGEWSTKYKIPPTLVPLIRPECILQPCQNNHRSEKDNKENKLIDDKNDNFNINDKLKAINFNNQTSVNDNNFNVSVEHNKSKLMQAYDDEKVTFENITNKLINMRTIIPKNEMLMTENFYNDNLFESVDIVDSIEAQAEFVRDLFKNESEKGCDNNNCDKTVNAINQAFENTVNDVNEKDVSHDCICKAKGVECEVGCGCICDECYSSCWPKDWIKEDHPDARVISINYTSDPYLWRPLWKSQCKRLELNERAEQMTEQLLELGVGQRPIIWVGHSKGGLFIKQIYCEAYESYLKLNGIPNHSEDSTNTIEKRKNSFDKTYLEKSNTDIENGNSDETSTDDRCGINYENENRIEKEIGGDSDEETESNGQRTLDYKALHRHARLWWHAAGFMFYSVPHRGSPLADIKTPLTTRSVELMEIRKDNATLLSLQARWLGACRPRAPRVASCFETRRTRMSLLWLTIVSQATADAGMGALCGVNVDHREICKPTSRKCILYTQLMNLMHAALERCHCQ